MQENSFDKIKNLKGKKLLRVLGIFALALILISVIVILISKQINKKEEMYQTKETLKSVKIQSNMLWLPNEPLPLPPIQFSREQKKIWSEEDVMNFYVDTNEKTMEELHKTNEDKIKILLEGTE